MIKRMHGTNSQRGFTLAEILVTTAIFAIIMIAALTVYDRSNQVFKQSTEAADLQQSTRIAFDKLVADLRMAGFDYDRGGPPTGANQYQQPDEQIEFAGPAAIAFRANLNYNSSAADCATVKPGEPCGNGLEPAYTPTTKDGQPIFPWVTTNNDEVIIYVLRSADSTKNADHIAFYVDSEKPRAAFPDAAGGKSTTNGKETKITVDGIDMSNANPPYTLYRMTLEDAVGKKQGTPVAENIRSLHFIYFSDLKGSTVLQYPPGPSSPTPTPIDKGRSADNDAFAATYLDASGATQYTGAIGGDGMYDANDVGKAGNYDDRTTRTFIQSVRVDLTGMNAQPDSKYVEPTETMTNIKNYRQYRLQSLVAPRNLGLTGFPEPAYSVPEPPTINGICTAHCAVPVICWKPANSSSPILQYEISWDTNPIGSFKNIFVVTDPTATSALLPDMLLDPSLTWYYRIKAVNDNGASEASNPISVQPKNSTKPTAPPSVGAVGGSYTLGVSWTAPSTNDPSKSKSTCTGGSCPVDPVTIPSLEQMRYNVFRSLQSTFDAARAVKVVSAMTTNKGPGDTVSWTDDPKTSAFRPGTCVDYYYWVQVMDRCFNGGNGSWNTSGDANDSISDLPNGTVSKATAQASDVSGATATAPVSASVNTGTSACPNAGGIYCDVDLRWSSVTTDSAGNAIGVDRYRITRYKKAPMDLTYALDTSFDIRGFSSVSGGTDGYKDSTAPAFNAAGESMSYQYTIAANDCRLGTASTPVTYPTPCAATPTIVQSGASNGATAAGTSPADAWIFNAGDIITVSAAAPATILKVDFDRLVYPSGAAAGGTATVALPGPYVYTWSDTGVSGQIYTVKITVTFVGGCRETLVRYVQQYTPAACAFNNQSPPTYSNAANKTTSGSDAIVNQNVTISNAGQDNLRFQAATVGSSSFTHSITVVWFDPNRASGTNPHNDLQLTEIDYSLPSGGTIKDIISSPPAIGASAATMTTTRTIPNTVTDLANGQSLGIKILFKYKKTEPDFTGTPISKICMSYHLFTTASPSVVNPNDTSAKFCNVVGQNASGTNNPTSCD